MSSFGVLPEGFKLKTLEDILTELQAAETAALGAGLNTNADSVIGQLNAILGDQFAQLWEVALAIYRSLYPDSASGEALDNVASITGVPRLAAETSKVLLHLNLAPGTAVPAGSKVAIGPKGSQFQTVASISNGDSWSETIDVQSESVDDGAIAGPAGSIDTIITPISGWTAKAAVTGANDENFVLVNGQTLKVKVDGDVEQTVTFLTADFISIGAALASEVVAKINSATTGLTAFTANTQVRLVSDTDGAGSSIEVTGGTANPALGFTVAKWVGLNPDLPAQAESVAEPFALVNNQTLTAKIDGGGTQTFTFITADFVAIGAATAIEVCKKINASITGGIAYSIGNGFVVIQSLTNGPNGSVEVTGGSANAALLFPTGTTPGAIQHGVSGAASLGRLLESDADFRLRRAQLLRLAGSSTLEAIRAGVRTVLDVLQVFILQNDTDTNPDANGLPPHSFECIVSGGADADIAAKIFSLKAAGIRAYGAAGPFAVIDSQGTSHDIYFTRPTEFDEYIAVTVKVDATVFGGGVTADGQAQVKTALATFGQTLTIGDDVIINKFIAAAIEVAGVIDVTVMKIEANPVPANTANIAIGIREVALFDTTRIVVTVI